MAKKAFRLVILKGTANTQQGDEIEFQFVTHRVKMRILLFLILEPRRFLSPSPIGRGLEARAYCRVDPIDVLSLNATHR